MLPTFGEWAPSLAFAGSFAGATIFRFLLLVEAVLNLIACREAREELQARLQCRKGRTVKGQPNDAARH